MYKAEVVSQTVLTQIGLIEMDASMSKIELDVKESIDGTVKAEAVLDMTPTKFLEFVRPILETLGLKLVYDEEEF